MMIWMKLDLTFMADGVGVAGDLISIETVKLASSQHRFYFDVHSVWETWTG